MKKLIILLLVTLTSLFANENRIKEVANSYVFTKFMQIPKKEIDYKYEYLKIKDKYAVIKLFPIYKDKSAISTEYIEDTVFHLCLKKINDSWKIVFELTRTDVPSKEQMDEISKNFPKDFPKDILTPFWQELFSFKTKKTLTRDVDSHSNVFIKKDNYTIIDILYGTDRKINKEEKKYFYEEYYGSNRGKLRYGVAQVTIPIEHKYGQMERPDSNILFYENEDENKHIIVRKLDELSNRKFNKILSAKIKNISSKDIMVFIHGFNNTFGDALRRTAQLTYDLEFKGIPVTYSWPSQGSGIGTYMQDESSVQYTTPHLVTFLSNLIENKGDAKLHILGHSMGTRALTNAIKEISYIYAGKKVFSNLILAAPDIDRDVFEVSLLPYISKTAEMLTLYASSDDNALKASKALHGATRLGLSEDIFVFDGLNTIDATGIDTSSLGHSYFVEKKIIIEDLKDMIYKVLPPEKRVRTLEERIKESHIYWKVKQ